MEVVGVLSGKVEINPGVKLPNRSSAENRALTREYLQKEFAELGLTAEQHQYSSRGANVFATLPSTTGSDEYIVVGAHFDSVRGGPGANDNATGVAMVMEAARHLSGMEERSANVIFVLFDEEETGLIGSSAFARKLKEEGLNVTSVHNVDQMGWDADGDRAIEIDGAATEMIEAYEKASAESGLKIPIHPINYGSTDHVPFKRAGFNAHSISEEYLGGDTTPYYHSPRDTYETVNWDFLASSSTLFDRVLEDLVEVEAAVEEPLPPAEEDWVIVDDCDLRRAS